MASSNRLIECLGEYAHLFSQRKKSRRRKHSEIRDWFSRLKPMERASVCTIQDPQWIQQLLLAFHQQGTQVRSFMMVVNDNKRYDIYNIVCSSF